MPKPKKLAAGTHVANTRDGRFGRVLAQKNNRRMTLIDFEYYEEWLNTATLYVVPTREEIEQSMDEIRAGWSERERQSRIVGPKYERGGPHESTTRPLDGRRGKGGSDGR